jgi:hypothetical protein
MGRASSVYKKMPGNWRAPFARRTLWQGPDHLLWVEKTLMQEHYRRFYFKDIQAVIVRRNWRHHVWTLFWAVLVCAGAGLAMLSAETPDLPDFFVPAGFALLGVIALLINWFRGPCCEFYLQTAVQLERLTNMVRQRRALKMADRIKALTEKAQGPFQMTAATGGHGAGARANRFPTAALATETQEPFQPRLHWALFAVLLCQGALGGLQLWLRQPWLVALGLIALGVTMVLAIIALVRGHRQIKGTLLGVVTWLTLALTAANGLSAYGLFIYASTLKPQYSYDHTALLMAFLELHLEDSTLIMAIVLGFAAGALLLGVIGSIAVVMQGGRRIKAA